MRLKCRGAVVSVLAKQYDRIAAVIAGKRWILWLHIVLRIFCRNIQFQPRPCFAAVQRPRNFGAVVKKVAVADKADRFRRKASADDRAGIKRVWVRNFPRFAAVRGSADICCACSGCGRQRGDAPTERADLAIVECGGIKKSKGKGFTFPVTAGGAPQSDHKESLQAAPCCLCFRTVQSTAFANRQRTQSVQPYP